MVTSANMRVLPGVRRAPMWSGTVVGSFVDASNLVVVFDGSMNGRPPPGIVVLHRIGSRVSVSISKLARLSLPREFVDEIVQPGAIAASVPVTSALELAWLTYVVARHTGTDDPFFGRLARTMHQVRVQDVYNMVAAAQAAVDAMRTQSSIRITSIVAMEVDKVMHVLQTRKEDLRAASAPLAMRPEEFLGTSKEKLLGALADEASALHVNPAELKRRLAERERLLNAVKNKSWTMKRIVHRALHLNRLIRDYDNLILNIRLKKKQS